MKFFFLFLQSQVIPGLKSVMIEGVFWIFLQYQVDLDFLITAIVLLSAIDSAIAVNAFPSSSSHLLPLIVKEVYRRKTELLQPSLMLLMLPIKAACEIGWFPDGEKNGLLMIAKEVSYGLSDTDKMNIEPYNACSTVTDIISRFYPTMKVEHVLTSFDVKAGYGIYVADFHFSMGTTPGHCKKLWLLVVQLDDMDTAACITNPLNVDFLINGSRVPNRTKNDMGEGPQLPSNITKLIKYGLNLLQVFGDFDGKSMKPQDLSYVTFAKRDVIGEFVQVMAE